MHETALNRGTLELNSDTAVLPRESTGQHGKILVSVIMPSYNYRSFLEDAVDSVLSQEIEGSLELIIVDDFSTDGSRELIRDIAGKDRRVRAFFHEKNMGIANTINDCIDAAEGEYLILVSSDDMLRPGALKKGLGIMADDNSIEFLIFDGECVDIEGKSLGYTLWQLKHPPDDEGRIFNELLISNFINPALIRRESLVKKNLRVTKELAYLNDWIFWLDAAISCKFKILREALYVYRIHGKNTSFSKDWMQDVAKGYAMMAERYSSRLTPSERGRLLYFAGISYFQSKNYASGRRFLLRALKTSPTSKVSIRGIAMFVLSYFGDRGLNAINAIGKLWGARKSIDMSALMEQHRTA